MDDRAYVGSAEGFKSNERESAVPLRELLSEAEERLNKQIAELTEKLEPILCESGPEKMLDSVAPHSSPHSSPLSSRVYRLLALSDKLASLTHRIEL